MSLSRRDLLKVGSLGALGALGLGVPMGGGLLADSASLLSSSLMPTPYRKAFVRPRKLRRLRTDVGPDGRRTAYYVINEQLGSASLISGRTTPLWGYNGTFPGPTIDVDQGTEVVLRMRNRLGAGGLFGQGAHTSTHLHGSASLPQYDGYASDITQPGQYKDYRYPNFQPARTLWYHDHGVHITAENVYSGLAAQYHLHDRWERANLPQGEFDVPLIISDAMFTANARLFYGVESSGLWGDVILVNGVPWPVMKVKRRVYRFRVLDASIARSYRPTLSTGDPVTVVATDGGVMPQAKQVMSWRHGSAERYEVLVDFSRYKAGQRVELLNLSNPNNRDYDDTDKIMAFDVVDDAFDTRDRTWNMQPTTLRSSPVMELKPTPEMRVTKLRVERKNGSWTINGGTWQDVIDSGFRKVVANPALDEVQIWEIENASGGWFHPVHIHLVDFQVLSRNGRPPFDYERGPKDVVYVGENETVRLLMKFEHQVGRYMVHCHNLPHEDHDMMQQFWVGPMSDNDPNHPVDAARPVKDDGSLP